MFREGSAKSYELIDQRAAKGILERMADNADFTHRNAELLTGLFEQPEPHITVTSRSSSISLSFFMDTQRSHLHNARYRYVSGSGGSSLSGKLVGIEFVSSLDGEESTPYLVLDAARDEAEPMYCYFELNRTLEGCIVS